MGAAPAFGARSPCHASQIGNSATSSRVGLIMPTPIARLQAPLEPAPHRGKVDGSF
jgi:hypothetical protein